MEIPKTVKTVQRALDGLKNKGLIARVGNTRTGYWKILDDDIDIINMHLKSLICSRIIKINFVKSSKHTGKSILSIYSKNLEG